MLRRQLMLSNTSSPRKPRKNSDDVKMLHFHWSTTSRVSCILRVWNVLPKTPVFRQPKLIFKDSNTLPKWTAGIRSKVTNSGASPHFFNQKGIAGKIKNRFWLSQHGNRATASSRSERHAEGPGIGQVAYPNVL